MEAQTTTSITLDYRQQTQIPMPHLNQYDTNIFEFTILDNGVAADLSNIDKITMNYKRPDNTTITKSLTAVGNLITYTMGKEEMDDAGLGQLNIQLFSTDQRISSVTLKVYMQSIPGADFEGGEGLPLLQELFLEASQLTADTQGLFNYLDNQAEYAKQQGDYSLAQGNFAKTEGDNANTNEITRQANESTRQANESTRETNETNRETNEATRQANEVLREQAKEDMESATTYANQQGDYAHDQGEYARLQGDNAIIAYSKANEALTNSQTALSDSAAAKTQSEQTDARIDNLIANTGDSNSEIVDMRLGGDGTVRNTAGDLIREIHSQQLDGARQSQELQHGVSIINSTQDGPVDIEVHGRTLVSMANSNLGSDKPYVIADKKYKVTAGGITTAGVGKFKGPNLTLTKADFVGKISGSVTENPHIIYHRHATSSLLSPSEMTAEWGSSYAVFDSLDGLKGSTGNISQLSGDMPLQMFSFNLIEQIERKMGRIPATDKVQWLKDNINKLTCNWHGYGSSPTGNKANVSEWLADTSQWFFWASHQSNGVLKLSPTETSNVYRLIDSNGFVHYLAHAEASDGVTASTINTDFVELEIELKTTAALDTRPSIIRIVNFEGKVANSTVENPHIAKRPGTGETDPGLYAPNSINWYTEIVYDEIKMLDGVIRSRPLTADGVQSQILFSFDLIAEVERQIGKIPGADTAAKVQWLKDNVTQTLLRWYGYGSNPAGNKATIATWNGTLWVSRGLHGNGNVTGITVATTDTAPPGWLGSNGVFIRPDGFIHFLAYAEASDGITASTINTDYVELEIQLKPTADIFNPFVPLFEVTQDEYDNILSTWTESEVVNRYPKAQGAQHLQNVAIIAEGENLLPPFYEWTLDPLNTAEEPYKITSSSTNTANRSYWKFPYKSGATYTMSATIIKGDFLIRKGSVTGDVLASKTLKTFTAPTDGSTLYAVVQPETNIGMEISNPILTLGSTAKPFTPRNPSYLFATAKLGQIGDKKDVLFKQDGAYYVRKVVEKDVVLDGSLAWPSGGAAYNYMGLKRIVLTSFLPGKTSNSTDLFAVSYEGSRLRTAPNSGEIVNAPVTDSVGVGSADRLDIVISNSLTGFTEAYEPTGNDWKRYFQGWKYTDGITWQSVTGNGETADATTALNTKPTDYTPYKLSYVLATPKTESISVEGDITVNGDTQVEVTSGVIVREKANPSSNSGGYHYINQSSLPSSALANRTKQILNIYKNGVIETIAPDSNLGWGLTVEGSTGTMRARIEATEFDSNAEYSVTYLILDRHLFTVNGTELEAMYDSSLKGVVDTLVASKTDTQTAISVLDRMAYDMLLRIKALEGA